MVSAWTNEEEEEVKEEVEEVEEVEEADVKQSSFDVFFH